MTESYTPRPALRRLRWPSRLALVMFGAALVTLASSPTADAAFPGANGQLVVADNATISTINPDGSCPRQITGGPESRVDDTDPVWSPDGQQIAFTRLEGTTKSIHVVNADGTGDREITSSGFQPAWSPDGGQIAFARVSSGTALARLFVINADGSGARQLSSDPNSGDGGSQPAWSPDGSRIAYSDGYSIRVIGSDGTGDRELAVGEHPSWSPDGRSIAFFRYVTDESGDVVGYEGDLYAMSSDGGAVQKLAHTDSARPAAAWSPDGTAVAWLHRQQVQLVALPGGSTRMLPSFQNGVLSLDWASRAPVRCAPPPRCRMTRAETASPQSLRSGIRVSGFALTRCRLTFAAKVRVGARTFRLAASTRTVAAGRRLGVRLRLPRKVRRAANARLRRGRRVTATVDIRLRDGTRRRQTLKLRLIR